MRPPHLAPEIRAAIAAGEDRLCSGTSGQKLRKRDGHRLVAASTNVLDLRAVPRGRTGVWQSIAESLKRVQFEERPWYRPLLLKVYMATMWVPRRIFPLEKRIGVVGSFNP